MTSPRASVGTLVLALDELLTDPEARSHLRSMRATTPTWLRDQVDAANDAIAAALRRMDGSDEVAVSRLPAADRPGWMRLGALDALATWVAGSGSTCLHGPSPMRPQPIMAAAWRPGLITCAETMCGRLLRLAPGSRADRTCDGCGHVTEPGGTLQSGLVVLGPMTWLFGTCAECRYWSASAGEVAAA